MQLLKVFPPQIKEWRHLAKEHFSNNLEAPAEQYFLEITPSEPEDKDIIYFNVSIEKKLVNIPQQSRPFLANMFFHFKVKTNNETPTAEFYFSLIETAVLNFAVYFYEKTKKTNLKGYKIQKANFELIRNDIQKAIDTWSRNNSINKAI